MKWHDDIEIGETWDLGEYVFSAERITAFAKSFDPQRFHLSEELAAQTPFRALCASGWHTQAVWMRLWCASGMTSAESGAGLDPLPGYCDLKWIRPVFAGDVIRYVSTCTAMDRNGDDAGFGRIELRNEALNQKGEPVMSFANAARTRLRVPPKE